MGEGLEGHEARQGRVPRHICQYPYICFGYAPIVQVRLPVGLLGAVLWCCEDRVRFRVDLTGKLVSNQRRLALQDTNVAFLVEQYLAVVYHRTPGSAKEREQYCYRRATVCKKPYMKRAAAPWLLLGTQVQ